MDYNYNQITVVKTTIDNVSESVITVHLLDFFVLISVPFLFYWIYRVFFKRKRK